MLLWLTWLGMQMKGTAFINRCCRKSTQMFEELYLQTQAGGLQALPGSLLESKNLGSNEALSTRPFCVMCKRVRATLAPLGQAASSGPTPSGKSRRRQSGRETGCFEQVSAFQSVAVSFQWNQNFFGNRVQYRLTTPKINMNKYALQVQLCKCSHSFWKGDLPSCPEMKKRQSCPFWGTTDHWNDTIWAGKGVI